MNNPLLSYIILRMIQNAMNIIIPSIFAWLTTMSTVRGSIHETTGSSSVGMNLIENEQLLHALAAPESNETSYNDPFIQLERFKRKQAAERIEIKKRAKERKAIVREAMKNMPQPKARDLERVTNEEFDIMSRKQKERGLNWFGDSSSNTNGISISSELLADPSQYYDKWAQGYRMLGGFIDCDHDKSNNNNHQSGDNNNNKDNQQEQTACSRWMIWASYVNPNYQGNEYDEYFGSNPTSTLDCHSPDTEWILLGVYRQEFYQYVEQISKHLWAVNDYEYVVALAGLSYMTKYECFQVGKDNNGNAIKASVAPQPYGKWEIALYTDDYCLTPDTSLGMTYDDFGLGSDVNLGSKDKNNGNDDYQSVQQWWYDAQEYTLTNLNDVYEEFKYCTSCVDYPTYQDGYFIGDYGTDDDDLINQCWKFYSHSSYTCEAECIAMAHAQGGILSIKYGDSVFGKTSQSFYQSSASTSPHIESPFSRLLASAFLTVSFLLFIATFLAFAVARRTRYRESRSSKSRRLLDNEDARTSSGRSRRSKSRTTRDGDGVFRESRGKSRDRRSASTKRSSSKNRRSRSKSYESPKDSRARPKGDDY